MPSCNSCNEDTTGSNRIRGMCKGCYDTEPLATGASCVLCGDTGMDFNHNIGIIRTKKGNPHVVCGNCWDNTSKRKDTFSWSDLPKKTCARCEKSNVLKYITARSCKSCLKKAKVLECTCCHSEIKEASVEKKNNKVICKSCIKRFYIKCSHCDTEFNARNIFNKRNGESKAKKVCDKCYNASKGAVMNYSHKPDSKYKPVFIDNTESKEEGVWNRGRKVLYLGVEVEMECKGYRNAIANSVRELSKDRVYNKDDSSINYGFEMVSHPMSLEYHLTDMNWEEIFGYLRDKGCLSHNTTSCGLHIHANKSVMTITDLKKLDVFINSHSREISKLARRHNSHADYKKLKKEDFTGKTVRSGRNALNLSPANTVEFRMFKGTLKYSTFISSLQFVDASIRFVKNVAWKDICDIEKSWKLFVAFVDNNNYKELSKYIKLKKLRKAFKENSSNLDQMIAKVNSTKLERFEERNESECA